MEPGLGPRARPCCVLRGTQKVWVAPRSVRHLLGSSCLWPFLGLGRVVVSEQKRTKPDAPKSSRNEASLQGGRRHAGSTPAPTPGTLPQMPDQTLAPALAPMPEPETGPTRTSTPGPTQAPMTSHTGPTPAPAPETLAPTPERRPLRQRAPRRISPWSNKISGIPNETKSRVFAKPGLPMPSLGKCVWPLLRWAAMRCWTRFGEHRAEFGRLCLASEGPERARARRTRRSAGKEKGRRRRRHGLGQPLRRRGAVRRLRSDGACVRRAAPLSEPAASPCVAVSWVPCVPGLAAALALWASALRVASSGVGTSPVEARALECLHLSCGSCTSGADGLASPRIGSDGRRHTGERPHSQAVGEERQAHAQPCR